MKQVIAHLGTALGALALLLAIIANLRIHQVVPQIIEPVAPRVAVADVPENSVDIAPDKPIPDASPWSPAEQEEVSNYLHMGTSWKESDDTNWRLFQAGRNHLTIRCSIAIGTSPTPFSDGALSVRVMPAADPDHSFQGYIRNAGPLAKLVADGKNHLLVVDVFHRDDWIEVRKAFSVGTWAEKSSDPEPIQIPDR